MAMTDSRWRQGADIVSMFPTLVWKIQLDDAVRDAVAAQVLGLLETLREGEPPLACGQGWQSERALHRHEALGELVGYVEAAMGSVLRFLRIGADAFKITGCWATVLAPGGQHRLHSHPNNYLSAVYYLRTAAGADTVNFHDPRAQTGVIRPPVVELTAANTDQVVVRVADGMLLVFPAWLAHSVDANGSERERISISFNMMFSDFTTTLAKPLW
ncbi:MAG TPA: TIGR02466 family protein [Rhodocyclaceae bacterium]|nr:TIGR02466 family protein [Rhodocyclaceae bacterium]